MREDPLRDELAPDLLAELLPRLVELLRERRFATPKSSFAESKVRFSGDREAGCHVREIRQFMPMTLAELIVKACQRPVFLRFVVIEAKEAKPPVEGDATRTEAKVNGESIGDRN